MSWRPALYASRNPRPWEFYCPYNGCAVTARVKVGSRTPQCPKHRVPMRHGPVGTHRTKR